MPTVVCLLEEHSEVLTAMSPDLGVEPAEALERLLAACLIDAGFAAGRVLGVRKSRAA